MVEKSALTPKQTRFVQEYLVDLNAAQAAIRSGYSAKTAETCGPRLLRNAQVKAAVEAGQAKVHAKLEISAGRVLQELARVGFADIRRLFDEHGNLRPICELDDDTAAAIASIEVEEVVSGDKTKTKTVTRKIRRHDKNAALTTLARHFRLIGDRIELTGANGEAVKIDSTVDLELARRALFILARVNAAEGDGPEASAQHIIGS